MNNDADAADGWDGDIQSDAETMTEKKFSFCEVDDEKIKEIMSGMTLRDMIGQKYIIGVSRTNWDLSAETKEKIEKLKIGGVFLAAPETIDLDPENTFEFIRILQEFSVEKNGVPLFISVDQEGGHAANINSMTGGTDTPGNMSLGAAQDAGDVERIYAIMGEELFSLGFNMDFAPVVDLMKNHMNGAINIRSFGGDAGWVRKAGAGSVRGLQSEGVIATVKHFPSDSTTALDSHIARPVYQKDENYWRSNDMLPYIDAFGAGADAVMMGHFILPFFDEKKPASLSAYIQNKILREEMGFDGLIITDSLGMKGANPEGKEESPELMAFKAG
ncbi:MAG: hypothetical protein FJ088_15345, partial [Deltaproteobacteria bacterium]|nr:hypothetical protein [Deltaproteobacteria bacterium]